jgi:DTW domain-containing protein YfiP
MNGETPCHACCQWQWSFRVLLVPGMLNLHKEKGRGKRKTQDPCEGCGLHKTRCLCEAIPCISLQTKISLVIHAKELKRTTNTGTLAHKALPNSEIFVRGLPGEQLDLSSLLSDNYRTFLFFPCVEAVELSAALVEESSTPIQLIVPDGNWRQASKVHHRHAELKALPRVMIKAKNPSLHHLRAETLQEGMATLQAIAYALGVIEGQQVQEQLLRLYQLKLETTLRARGTLNKGNENA